MTIPLGSNASGDLIRYFQIRKAWELGRYTSLSEADLIFRNQAKARFAGQRFEHLYRGWKVEKVTDADILKDFGGNRRRSTIHFAAEKLRLIAPAPEQNRVETG